MLAAFDAGGTGSFPASARGIELSIKGVLVTSFGKNTNGGGTFILV